jgi:hypothetical protein
MANRFAIRTLHDKMITEPNQQFLFDIQKDVSEKKNMALEQGPKLIEMSEIINSWKRQLINPRFMGLMEEDAYLKLHPDRFGRD